MAATGGVRAMQSTVTVHTQPSMARPGSPEQWGFGASLASVRPGSPYEQWGSPEQPAAGDSFEQWGYSLASAARRRAPSPGPRPASPGASPGRPRSPDPWAYLRPDSPQNLRIASVQARAAAEAAPSPAKPSFGAAPPPRRRSFAAPSAAKTTTAELAAKSQCFARPDLNLKKVCQVVPRDAAAEREARRLAHRRARHAEAVARDADACRARGGVLATMLKASDEAALSPTYKTELRLFRGGFEEEGAAVAAKQNRRRGLGAKLRAAGQAVLASVLIADDAHRAARRRDPRREAAEFMERQRGGAKKLGADGDAAKAQRAARAADEAAAQASMRRGGDWLRLEGLRAREKAGKPLDDVDAKMLRRLEAKHDGAVFAAARLRGIKEREAAEAARAQRLASMKRRDEEIQLQRKLEKQKRGSRVRRFFGAGKRAPRRVPRGDGDESTVAPTVASAKTFDVAPSNAATVASSNSGGHSGGHSGDHSGDATVASSQNLGDLSPLTAAPPISFDDDDADGESVQSPFDRG